MPIKPLTLTAASLLIAMPAFAQVEPPSTVPASPPVAGDLAMPPAVDSPATDATGAIDRPAMDDPNPEPAAVSVDQWIGIPVISADGVNVGKVSDVEVDTAGRPVFVTAEIGGFLGFGADTVRLPVTESDFAGGELRVGMVETDIEAIAADDERSAIGVSPD